MKTAKEFLQELNPSVGMRFSNDDSIYILKEDIYPLMEAFADIAREEGYIEAASEAIKEINKNYKPLSKEDSIVTK